jgi:pSer/pThr/pTyr-binding forkhead associated (FHA) protein
MVARLVCQVGIGKVQEIPLSHLPVLVGRSEQADIRLEDRWMSRKHCEIDARNGVLVVRDLGSRHGTWLNNQRVVEAEIHPGDELAIGLTTLQADYTECTP